MNFSSEEILAIKLMIHHYAKMIGEDIIGTITYSGGFHYVGQGKGVVDLARKLEVTEEELFPWRKLMSPERLAMIKKIK